MFIVVIMLAGSAVAVLRRRLQAGPGTAAEDGDAPARMLGWVVGLLAPERAEWRQAMLGELGHLQGRARRWRFAAGCVAGAMVLPPTGRAAAAAGTLAAIGAAGFGLFAHTSLHYGLGHSLSTWVGAAILLAILKGYLLAGSVLLRRPGVAVPGLAGGLFVTAAWLVASGLTFDGYLSPITTRGTMLLLIAAPAVVGAGGALRSGSATVGRRAARLAAVSSGLGLYLYGVLAVTAVGAGGPPGLPHATVAGNVADRLGNQVGFGLILVPLVTATVGWAAASATARLRRARPAVAQALAAPGPMPSLAAGQELLVPGSWPATAAGPAWPAPGPEPAAAAARARIWYRLLLGAIVAAAVILAFVAWLPGR